MSVEHGVASNENMMRWAADGGGGSEGGTTQGLTEFVRLVTSGDGGVETWLLAHLPQRERDRFAAAKEVLSLNEAETTWLLAQGLGLDQLPNEDSHYVDLGEKWGDTGESAQDKVEDYMTKTYGDRLRSKGQQKYRWYRHVPLIWELGLVPSTLLTQRAILVGKDKWETGASLTGTERDAVFLCGWWYLNDETIENNYVKSVSSVKVALSNAQKKGLSRFEALVLAGYGMEAFGGLEIEAGLYSKTHKSLLKIALLCQEVTGEEIRINPFMSDFEAEKYVSQWLPPEEARTLLTVGEGMGLDLVRGDVALLVGLALGYSYADLATLFGFEGKYAENVVTKWATKQVFPQVLRYVKGLGQEGTFPTNWIFKKTIEMARATAYFSGLVPASLHAAQLSKLGINTPQEFPMLTDEMRKVLTELMWGWPLAEIYKHLKMGERTFGKTREELQHLFNYTTWEDLRIVGWCYGYPLPKKTIKPAGE